MKRCAVAAALMAVLTFLPGCAGPPAPKMAAKADVAGTVNLDGKPMDEPEAEISFSIPGEAPISFPIKGGKFEGKGPAGAARVEVRAWRKGEPIMMGDQPIAGSDRVNYVAEQFNDKSTLSAKIEAAGSKSLKFDVESKK